LTFSLYFPSSVKMRDVSKWYEYPSVLISQKNKNKKNFDFPDFGKSNLRKKKTSWISLAGT